MSEAVWYRSLGLFAIAVAAITDRYSGTSEFISAAVGANSDTCWYATATGLSPVKGGRPASIS